jgi:hypothetical protein
LGHSYSTSQKKTKTNSTAEKNFIYGNPTSISTASCGANAYPAYLSGGSNYALVKPLIMAFAFRRILTAGTIDAQHND